jgi:hypothetical protein
MIKRTWRNKWKKGGDKVGERERTEDKKINNIFYVISMMPYVKKISLHRNGFLLIRRVRKVYALLQLLCQILAISELHFSGTLPILVNYCPRRCS